MCKKASYKKTLLAKIKINQKDFIETKMKITNYITQ